jgi:co-chaperonin GroES (HSP10)
MIKPLRDKIFVRPEQRIKSELYIQTAEADTVGYITAVGEEAEEEGLKVGDKVYFGTIAKNYKDEYLKFKDFKDGNEKLIVMSWQDVCFIEEIE